MQTHCTQSAPYWYIPLGDNCNKNRHFLAELDRERRAENARQRYYVANKRRDRRRCIEIYKRMRQRYGQFPLVSQPQDVHLLLTPEENVELAKLGALPISPEDIKRITRTRDEVRRRQRKRLRRLIRDLAILKRRYPSDLAAIGVKL